ncbi:MAG TPA: hypothetical protein PLD20_05400 [Blastocatellia bacterium]|nr:hypothetical protein [Blastocatellia bacterium]HMX24513.1 hypothetical protein [Blastocatellia bacterium]HMZ17343.1 hypothetical protein [Blastocatellia bacterium]
MKKLQKDSMICPCCGEIRPTSVTECGDCGARQIGKPLAPPDVLLPKLGLPFAALACATLVTLTFLAVWVFGNDMKVGRVFLVSLFGDGTKLTHDLLQADPKLPYYRIFSFDAYRLAFLLSAGLIPASMIGIWLGWKAMKKAKTDPIRFGGLSLARFSTVFSVCLFTIFSSVTAASIPGAMARREAKQVAATRSTMYAMHAQALQKYHREYGSYPQELTDLSRVNAETVTGNDYWENSFSYLPVGVIASRGSAVSFSDYKLVSAGPDGKFGTADDITMIDGVIVNSQTTDNLPGTLPVMEKRQ